MHVIEDIPALPAFVTGQGGDINEAMDGLAENLGYVHFSSINLVDSDVLYLHGVRIKRKETATSSLFGRGNLPWVTRTNNFLHGSCLKIRREGDTAVYEAPYYESVSDGTASSFSQESIGVNRETASNVRHGWLIGGMAGTSPEATHGTDKWTYKTATGKKPVLDYISGEHNVNLWIYQAGHVQNTCTP